MLPFLHAHAHIVSQPQRRASRPYLRVPLIEVGRSNAILLSDGVTGVSAHHLVPLLAGANGAGLRRGRRTGAAGRGGVRRSRLGRCSGDT
jgi:hypothetical protein